MRLAGPNPSLETKVATGGAVNAERNSRRRGTQCDQGPLFPGKDGANCEKQSCEADEP